MFKRREEKGQKKDTTMEEEGGAIKYQASHKNNLKRGSFPEFNHDSWCDCQIEIFRRESLTFREPAIF